MPRPRQCAHAHVAGFRINWELNLGHILQMVVVVASIGLYVWYAATHETEQSTKIAMTLARQERTNADVRLARLETQVESLVKSIDRLVNVLDERKGRPPQ